MCLGRLLEFISNKNDGMKKTEQVEIESVEREWRFGGKRNG